MNSCNLQLDAGPLGEFVPAEVRKRIGIARDLAVCGAFCYNFLSVSVFWSCSNIEMARWQKYTEIEPVTSRKKTMSPLVEWAKSKDAPAHVPAEFLAHRGIFWRIRKTSIT